MAFLLLLISGIVLAKGRLLDTCRKPPVNIAPNSTMCSIIPIRGVNTTICRRVESNHDVGIITRELNADTYQLTTLKPTSPGIVLEFGCNIGMTAITTARIHPGLTIYCFEPFPETCEFATRNIMANGLEGRIKVQCCGVSWKTESTTYYYHPSFPGGSGAGADRRGQGPQVTVNTVDVSVAVREILDAHPKERVEFIKVDCEGCEGIVVPTLEHMMDYEPRLKAPSSGEFHPWQFQGKNYIEGKSLLPGWNEQMILRAVCISSNRHKDFDHCPSQRRRIKQFVRGSAPFEEHDPGQLRAFFASSKLSGCVFRGVAPHPGARECYTLPQAPGQVCGQVIGLDVQDYFLRRLGSIVRDLSHPSRAFTSGFAVIVGCEVGSAAIQMANMLPNITIFCFEENRGMCAMANRNIEASGMVGRIVVLCCGLTGDTGEVAQRSKNTAIAMRTLNDRVGLAQFGSLEVLFYNCNGCEAKSLVVFERMMASAPRLRTPYVFGVKRPSKALPPGWTQSMTDQLLCRKYEFLNC